ncbi:F-box domain-containing protein [Favolaschia claudopus]|uniref:F-box domain-containing protein n=1 Tax=Favolaschia claudopus TaxID=2862362 RepID=A0AAW0AM56_9AGAR
MLGFLAADRAFLAGYDAEIQALEAQVAAIKSSISLLRAARRTARQRLRCYKYPVLTLPNEIIAEIFLRFLPLYPDVQPLLGDLSPMRLTHICRQWRDIACTTPQLWRAIDLNPKNVDNLPTILEGTLALTDLWVSRSGHCPLSIRMGSQHDPLSILAPLIPHCNRWEHLTWRLDSTRPLSWIRSLPLLKSFDLEFSTSAADDEIVVLQDLPLLSTVILDDFRIPHIILPWSQLTSLTLKWIYPGHCVSILQQTTRLVQCTLLLGIADETENDFVNVVLPHLETLDVQAEDDIDANFFQCLVTPALHYLCFPEHLLQPNPIQSLNLFISRSGCHLDKLLVTEASVSQNAYSNAFHYILDVDVQEPSDSDFESD